MISYRTMLEDAFKNSSNSINQILNHLKISVNFVNKHIIDRAIERDIDIYFISKALNEFKKHLCEFVFLASLPENDRPWNIELKGNGVILVLARRNETEWRFKTILDPAKHSKYNDEKTSSFYNTIDLHKGK